jgi:hypothetical protein
MVLLPLFHTVWQVVEFVWQGRASAGFEIDARAVATARMVTKDLMMVIGRLQFALKDRRGMEIAGARLNAR